MFTIWLDCGKGWQIDESPKRAATHWIDARLIDSNHPGFEGRKRVKIRAIASDFPDGLPELKPGQVLIINTRSPIVKAKNGGCYFFLVPQFEGAKRPQTAVISGMN